MLRVGQTEPVLMKPAIFIPGFILVGLLFAFQEWMSLRHMGYHVRPEVIFEWWSFQFLAWGIVCWLVWHFFRSQIERSNLITTLAAWLPISIALSVALQMLYVFVFRNLPLNHPEPSFWRRLSMYVYAELLDNMLVFWCAFFLFRGIGYYQRYREHERAKAELEVRLANAQLAALRMQLNPHFLFNTMNSISSLMRTDVEAADDMLDQLSCLLRMSLERGDSQLISLREEMEFIELYLAMQGRRYAGKVTQSVRVDPDLYDAQVPSMLLQPIVENAYVHGLSRTEAMGALVVEGTRQGNQVKLTVMNTGIGLNPGPYGSSEGHGVGLRNIQKRLDLHFGKNAKFEIRQIDARHVQVSIVLPLQYPPHAVQPTARFGLDDTYCARR